MSSAYNDANFSKQQLKFSIIAAASKLYQPKKRQCRIRSNSTILIGNSATIQAAGIKAI